MALRLELMLCFTPMLLLGWQTRRRPQENVRPLPNSVVAIDSMRHTLRYSGRPHDRFRRKKIVSCGSIHRQPKTFLEDDVDV